ncbi:MAG: LolA family protein [Thermodesulfobacteriota bacterium]
MQTTLRKWIIAVFGAILCSGIVPPDGGAQTDAGKILDRLESRYAGKNFSADFVQQSTLKAMDITDTAKGRVWFKHPGMMRWEYKTPEQHAIVTDGTKLWIYRPADNQVVIGDAASHFGNGKGASFLSNFSLVKDAFEVSLNATTDTHYRLKLVPIEKQYDLSAIYLEVDRKSLDITEVVSENEYDDITRISFKEITFHSEMDNKRFHFDIPPEADVVRMEE